MSHDGPHEIELKRLLFGDRAGDRLVAALGGAVQSEHRQVNHVLDTRDRRLSAARFALRLRMENGDALLGAKGPTRDAGTSTGSKLEAESRIDADLACAILAGERDPVAALRERAGDPAYAELFRAIEATRRGEPIVPRGQFANVRRTVRATLPHGLSIAVEIDRTTFPDGRVDEEVEIELPDERVVPEAEAWLDSVTRSAGITTRPSTPKVARFWATVAGGAHEAR